MGRLIDADVVEDTLKKCVSNAYKRRDIQCATGVSLAILQLRNIPTAYDVEKVVEELASNSRFIDDINEHNIKCISCVIGQKTAIDIVKKGGAE